MLEADRSLDARDPVSDLQIACLAFEIAVRSFCSSPFSFLVALDMSYLVYVGAPKLISIFDRSMAKASCLCGNHLSHTGNEPVL
jgi:hypothetical protein